MILKVLEPFLVFLDAFRAQMTEKENWLHFWSPKKIGYTSGAQKENSLDYVRLSLDFFGRRTFSPDRDPDAPGGNGANLENPKNLDFASNFFSFVFLCFPTYFYVFFHTSY